MQAGITGNKSFNPRELVGLLSHRINVVVPHKEVPPFTKLGLKLDPRISGFGQGYSLGLTAFMATAANQGAAGMPVGGVPNQPMVAGQTVPTANVTVGNPAGYPVPVGGAPGMPASNSIIINPNGGNAQASRKLAQINQSMHPGAVQQGGPPRPGTAAPTTLATSGAPGVVVAIPNATASVTVMPRGNANNGGANTNAPVAPTVNVSAATPVVPSTTPAAPTPTPAAKPSPSKRSKKTADGAATGSTKRQRGKNTPAAAAPAPVEQAQPQPTTPQPVQATPQPVQTPTPVIQQQPHVTQAQPQHTHLQAQPLQHQQLHQLQQIQQQLLQHQPHLGQSQPVNTVQIQPNQLSHQAQPHIVTNVTQAQHMQPGMMHPQYPQQTNPAQSIQQPQQQNQPIQTTQPYATPQYTATPTYATAGTYTTPSTYTAPATGITYTTTYANPGYSAQPGSAPSTYTTPATTNYATTNYTNPSYSTGAAPAYVTTPNTYTTTTSSTVPTTYVAPTSASNTFTSAPSGFVGAPSTYIPNSVSSGAFTTPSTTSYSAPGFAPQGMVIGIFIFISCFSSLLL